MTIAHIKFRQPKTAAARFWAKVDKSNECWNWNAGLTNKGYGQFQAGYGPVLAHRVSWFLTYGEEPNGMCVLHRCDNRRCVKPDHLFLGTKADNNHDMLAKGRHKGWPHARGSSQLSLEQVAEIKALAGSTSQKTISKQFGISASHVCRIVKGWVPTP